MYTFLILLDLSNFISKKHLFWPQRGMQGGKHIHSELREADFPTLTQLV